MSYDEPDDFRDDLAETRERESEPLPSRAVNVVPPERGDVWRERGTRAWRFTRTMAITVLVLVGLAGIGNIAIHHFPRTSTHTYKYDNIQRLFIVVDGNSSVDIHGVDGDRVTVKATDRSTLLEPVQRQLVSAGGWLTITVHCPSSECSSRYDIQVPRSSSVYAVLDHSSEQANITAQDLHSAVDLFTGRGDVTISQLATTSDVKVVANGQVTANNISAANLDVFAPIGNKIDLHVTGDISTIQNIRVTAGLPAVVTLTVPAGGYRISCQPAGRCTGSNGDVTQDMSGPVHEDVTSSHNIQVNVVPQTTATILAG